jgi:hypothetical protein
MIDIKTENTDHMSTSINLNDSEDDFKCTNQFLVSALNVRGINNKILTINNLIAENSPDIMILTEI